jgi:hypothetical protein
MARDKDLIHGRGGREVREGMDQVNGGLRPDRGVLPPIENRVPPSPPPEKKDSK